MKVKYSNKFKNTFSHELLSDMVRLSYTILPLERYHYFTITKYSELEIKIVHTIPSIRVQSSIIRKCNNQEKFITEEVVLVFLNKNIYICLASEYIIND